MPWAIIIAVLAIVIGVLMLLVSFLPWLTGT
jgi:hypothetical protein